MARKWKIMLVECSVCKRIINWKFGIKWGITSTICDKCLVASLWKLIAKKNKRIKALSHQG